jgi:hypothetical protein
MLNFFEQIMFIVVMVTVACTRNRHCHDQIIDILVHKISSLQFFIFKNFVTIISINYNPTKIKQSWPNEVCTKPIS